MHLYTDAYKHTHIYIYTHMQKSHTTHIQNTCINIYAYNHTFTYVHIHTQIHLYTYMQTHLYV